MRKHSGLAVVFALALSALFLMGMGASHKEAAPAGSVAAVAAAKSKGISVFVDVGSTHCKPCRQMVPVLDALTKKYKGRMDVVFVDIEEERSFASELGVSAIPTQIVYDSSGREVARHVGYISIEDCEALLKKSGI